MYYKLFLDDERKPSQVTWIEMPLGPWMVVRSYDEFVKCIKENGMPAYISFDHDLAHEHYRASMYNPDRHYNKYYTDGTFKEMTGYGCAQWLVEYCMDNKVPVPEYRVHSMNTIGKENIEGLLESYKRSCS